MRRLLVVLGVLLVLVVAASPAQASGNVHRSTIKGPGAQGYWSTLPAGAQPEPGVVYTDTYLETAAQTIWRLSMEEGHYVLDV